MMMRILKVMMIVIASLMTLFMLLVGYFALGRGNDLLLQNVLIDRMEKIYGNDYKPIDDQIFASFDPDTSDIRFSEIKMLASHNSYKKKGSDLGKLLIGLGDSFAMANALKYGYDDISTQLQSGIRSMEWDVRLRRGQFELTHVPLVDSRSTAPNMEKAIRELKLYSDANPGHLPIVILIELKTDWMVLDPFLDDMTAADLIQLDDMIGDVLGETLFSPGDMIKEGLTLNETVTTEGWPLIHEMLGRILFVLHPSSFTAPYVGHDETLMSLAMFPGVYHDNIATSYAAFVVHNFPDVAVISALVSQGYIVRTRIDEDLVFEQTRFDDSLRSGAQILSSDFTVGRSDLTQDQMIDLGSSKTVIESDN